VSFAPVETLKLIFERFFENFSQDERKSYIRSAQEWRERNLLTEAVAKNKNFESIKFLWNFYEENFNREEILEILNETDIWENLFFHIAVVHSSSFEIFDFLWGKIESFFNDAEKFKKYLQISGPKSQNILSLTLVYRNEITFKYLMDKIFGDNPELFEIFHGPNESSWIKLASWGNNAMIKYALEKLKSSCSIEKFKEILGFKGSFGKNALFASIMAKNVKTFYELFGIYFDTFKPEELLSFVDSRGENFIHYITRYSLRSVIKYSLDKLGQVLTPEEIKKYLDIRPVHGYNILHLGFCSNKHKVSLVFLMKCVETFFGKGESLKMLLELNSDKVLPFHKVIEYNNGEIFEFVLNLYEDIFNEIQIKNILEMRVSPYNTNLNKTLLDFTVDHAYRTEMIELVENVLQKYEIS
jgi:hypothetical protein